MVTEMKRSSRMAKVKQHIQMETLMLEGLKTTIGKDTGSTLGSLRQKGNTAVFMKENMSPTRSMAME